MKVSKIEQLKFKMKMQNQSLKALSEHATAMSENFSLEKAAKKKVVDLDGKEINIDSRRHNLQVKQVSRQNNAMQNQQISRFERDLERTSKQLQIEISML